jgi:hypothetical protein
MSSGDEGVAVVDLRCDQEPHKLLARLRLEGEQPRYVHPENLIELSCRECSRAFSERRGERVRVRHRFSFAGDLVATVVVRADSTG